MYKLIFYEPRREIEKVTDCALSRIKLLHIIKIIWIFKVLEIIIVSVFISEIAL